MAGLVEDHRARVVQALAVPDRVVRRDDVVVASPDDQGRNIDVLEPVEDVVAEQASNGRQHAGLAVPMVKALPKELLPEAVGRVKETGEQRVPQSRTAHAAVEEPE